MHSMATDAWRRRASGPVIGAATGLVRMGQHLLRRRRAACSHSGLAAQLPASRLKLLSAFAACLLRGLEAQVSLRLQINSAFGVCLHSGSAGPLRGHLGRLTLSQTRFRSRRLVIRCDSAFQGGFATKTKKSC